MPPKNYYLSCFIVTKIASLCSDALRTCLLNPSFKAGNETKGRGWGENRTQLSFSAWCVSTSFVNLVSKNCTHYWCGRWHKSACFVHGICKHCRSNGRRCGSSVGSKYGNEKCFLWSSIICPSKVVIITWLHFVLLCSVVGQWSSW